ncbi:radical SAM protein [bacterium]
MEYRKTRKSILKIGYECNNNCVFCHALDNHGRAPLGIKDIEKKILLCRECGTQTVILSGGEPTIRKDFPDIVNLIRENGMMPGLISNGRMLAYGKFAEQYIRCNPEYTYISIHAHSSRLHDAITRTPSFLQTLTGIKNIRGKVDNLTLNVVVTGDNIACLKKIVDLVISHAAPCRLKFSLLEPKGAALESHEKLIPDMLAAARAIEEAIDYFEHCVSDPVSSTGCDGFTPCTISEFVRYRADLITDNINYMSETYEDKLYSTDNGVREYVEACMQCAERINCPGIYTGYLKRAGCSIAKAVVRPSPNSFLYTFEQSRGIVKGDVNPACGGVCRELDPFMNVALMQDDNIKIYETRTGDFGVDAIRTVKFDKNQVYLNASCKLKDIDFRRDLVKLKLYPGCEQCPFVHTCAGLFIPVSGNVFEGYEETEKKLIKGLRGNVLDVGCGMPHYRTLLEKMVERGEIDYLGIDINPPAGSRLRILKKSIEYFESERECFDAALVLRSYNHFEDLSSAFRKIAELLKPRGKLLIIDNSIYAVLKESSNEKNSCRKKFEHFRNHFSEDAISFLKIVHPFKIIRHIPVCPDGPNQWLLLLEKQNSSGG